MDAESGQWASASVRRERLPRDENMSVMAHTGMSSDQSRKMSINGSSRKTMLTKSILSDAA